MIELTLLVPVIAALSLTSPSPGVRGIGRGSGSSPLPVASGWSGAAPPAVTRRGSRPFSSVAAACLSEILPELNACGQMYNVLCCVYTTV